MKQAELLIPVMTVSESNSSEHWTKKSKRHKLQKKMVWAIWSQVRPIIKLPCIIRISRIAPRVLDDSDNLPISMKWIKDAVSAKIFPEKIVVIRDKDRTYQNLGFTDDSKEITWEYSQEKGNVREYAVRVEVFNCS